MSAKVIISWTPRPAGENVKSYRVYERRNGEDYLRIEVPGAFTSATLFGVSQGSREYFVTAVNAVGEGLQSSPITVPVFPPALTPGVVAGVTASVPAF